MLLAFIKPLSTSNRWLLGILSFFIVALGQPAFSPFLGIVAGCIGFALFWRVLLDFPKALTRFLLGTAWFGAVHIVQLDWMLSHPYLYIYALVLFLGALFGAQFGLLSIFIKPATLFSISRILAVAGFWTFMEWLRLFILSGYTWNPVGLALTGYDYPLQLSSVIGIYGLSFWVILTNLFALRAWYFWPVWKPFVSCACFVIFPFLFGIIHFQIHEKALVDSLKNPDSHLTALLVQTSFPIEESMEFKDYESLREYVLGEWEQILSILAKHDAKGVELIVLPEYVVPFGTYYEVFPLERVYAAFEKHFGKESLDKLPPLVEPLANLMQEKTGPHWMVSNAYWAQAISNLFNTDVVIGLEDVSRVGEKKYCYSVAYYFKPILHSEKRYEKRILVPMGEYIPFEFCKELAAKYGVGGSFTCGTSAKVFQGKVPFGLSICYEETYGDLMRESRMKGAELIVNLTSDAWYPNSRLPKQHFDHAKLRAVESGVPLVRSCNTGITGAVDSLGQVVAILEKDGEVEKISDALRVDVPLYHYRTVYTLFGDLPILLLSGFFILFAFYRSRKGPR